MTDARDIRNFVPGVLHNLVLSNKKKTWIYVVMRLLLNITSEVNEIKFFGKKTIWFTETRLKLLSNQIYFTWHSYVRYTADLRKERWLEFIRHCF